MKKAAPKKAKMIGTMNKAAEKGRFVAKNSPSNMKEEGMEKKAMKKSPKEAVKKIKAIHKKMGY